MIENKYNENKFTKADYRHTLIIALVSLFVIVGTWIVLSKKYENYPGPQKMNNSFQYAVLNNQVRFLDADGKRVNHYDCISDCQLILSDTKTFALKVDNIAYISDDEKIQLYDIVKNEVINKFDKTPQASSEMPYGLTESNKKLGLISDEGKVVIENKYDSITKKNNYIIANESNKIDIYNLECKIITEKPITIKSDEKVSNIAYIDGVIEITAGSIYRYNIETKELEVN